MLKGNRIGESVVSWVERKEDVIGFLPPVGSPTHPLALVAPYLQGEFGAVPPVGAATVLRSVARAGIVAALRVPLHLDARIQNGNIINPASVGIEVRLVDALGSLVAAADDVYILFAVRPDAEGQALLERECPRHTSA